MSREARVLLNISSAKMNIQWRPREVRESFLQRVLVAQWIEYNTHKKHIWYLSAQNFVQVICTSVNGITYGTNYQLSRDKSSGLVKLAM